MAIIRKKMIKSVRKQWNDFNLSNQSNQTNGKKIIGIK